VICALYTDLEDVSGLIDDLKGEWLENNRKHGYPVSIVLSGLFDDIHRCCEKTGSREHALVRDIRLGETTPAVAAENVARPCVCGIVNRERAAALFHRLARGT
jgi:hypothetical protein